MLVLAQSWGMPASILTTLGSLLMVMMLLKAPHPVWSQLHLLPAFPAKVRHFLPQSVVGVREPISLCVLHNRPVKDQPSQGAESVPCRKRLGEWGEQKGSELTPWS